jgi:hypothetical protein
MSACLSARRLRRRSWPLYPFQILACAHGRIIRLFGAHGDGEDRSGNY